MNKDSVFHRPAFRQIVPTMKKLPLAPPAPIRSFAALCSVGLCLLGALPARSQVVPAESDVMSFYEVDEDPTEYPSLNGRSLFGDDRTAEWFAQNKLFQSAGGNAGTPTTPNIQPVPEPAACALAAFGLAAILATTRRRSIQQ